MTLRSSGDEDKVFTAIHEIGHEWAHHHVGRAFRYMTVRPRQLGLAGVCRSWPRRRTDTGESMQIAAAGPITEAMYSVRYQRADDDESLSFLSDAIALSGQVDAEQACGLLNLPEAIELTRVQLEADWPTVERLAGMFVDRGTVPGRRRESGVKFIRSVRR